MKIGDKYFAEWWFNYDMADCISANITIKNIFKDGSYSFTYENKWGVITYYSNRCRRITLIRKINMSRYIVIWNKKENKRAPLQSGHKELNDTTLFEFLHEKLMYKYGKDGENLSEETFSKVIKKVIKDRFYEDTNPDTGALLIIEIDKI